MVVRHTRRSTCVLRSTSTPRFSQHLLPINLNQLSSIAHAILGFAAWQLEDPTLLTATTVLRYSTITKHFLHPHFPPIYDHVCTDCSSPSHTSFGDWAYSC